MYPWLCGDGGASPSEYVSNEPFELYWCLIGYVVPPSHGRVPKSWKTSLLR